MQMSGYAGQRGVFIKCNMSPLVTPQIAAFKVKFVQQSNMPSAPHVSHELLRISTHLVQGSALDTH